MTATATDALILEEIFFAGEILANGESAPISFRVSAGADCRLIMDVDPLDAAGYLLATRGQSAPGTIGEEFTISGRSADGKTFESEHVFVGAHGSYSDGHWIRIGSHASKITLPLDRPVDKPVLRLWFRSFKTFRNPVIETSLGRLAVQGEARGVSPDDMSGSVTLEAPRHDPGSDWYGRADDFLRHMHRGLALAHGGRLQTPRLDYMHGSTGEVTFFDGEGSKPELPVQHHLNQGPYIAALAERFDRAGPLPEMLWTALGWMQIDTTFDEVRFLTAVTALEAIIESELPERQVTVVPREDFRPLRQQIETLIANAEILSEEAREILMNKAAQLNAKSFSQKVHALFEHYNLPRQDFEGGAIRSLIQLRNHIVHRGVSPRDIDIWPHIILAREIITRILLREIGFIGRYCCYVGGLNDRNFPGPNETKSTDTA